MDYGFNEFRVAEDFKFEQGELGNDDKHARAQPYKFTEPDYSAIPRQQCFLPAQNALNEVGQASRLSLTWKMEMETGRMPVLLDFLPDFDFGKRDAKFIHARQ